MGSVRAAVNSKYFAKVPAELQADGCDGVKKNPTVPLVKLGAVDFRDHLVVLRPCVLGVTHDACCAHFQVLANAVNCFLSRFIDGSSSVLGSSTCA